MLVRRMLLLVAILMAITAVAVALAPREDTGTAGTQAAPPPRQAAPSADASPAGTSPAEADARAPSDAPVETMRAGEEGQVIRVTPGEEVLLRVVADGLESIQLGADGPIEVADRESPAEFDLLPERGYAADVRLLESGRTIGRLTTEP